MTLILFCQAFLIGLFLALPLGPIGLLCMRNSLYFGMRYGVVTGMGSAAADALYSVLALFGMIVLSGLLIQYHHLVHAIGGLILCLVGLRTLWASQIPSQIALNPIPLILLFFLSFGLTLANPGTLLLICALYSNFEICLEHISWHRAWVLPLGIFLGATTWWIILSFFTSWSRRKVPLHILLRIHRIMGAIFIVIGCIAILNALRGTIQDCAL